MGRMSRDMPPSSAPPEPTARDPEVALALQDFQGLGLIVGGDHDLVKDGIHGLGGGGR